MYSTRKIALKTQSFSQFVQHIRYCWWHVPVLYITYYTIYQYNYVGVYLYSIRRIYLVFGGYLQFMCKINLARPVRNRMCKKDQNGNVRQELTTQRKYIS